MSRGLPLLACLFLSLGSVADAADAPKPNLILILADDLGYECLGCNGSTSYKTPALDRLAADGMRFRHCYVQPLCTPTRVQLMTGQYNVRNYINFGLLDPNATTFAHLLKRAGYATAIAGKWQLGHGFDGPKKFGFDEYCLWQLTRRPPRYANPGLEINGKQIDYAKGEYGPDLVSDYALDFIARNQSRPFFLYYPMMLTHAPYQPTPDSPDWDAKAKGEQVHVDKKHFGEMVAYMDKLVGKLVAKLDDLKLRQNTLVLFVGDNGTGRGVNSRMGDVTVAGGKGTTTTTGMHVPFVANWPGVIPAGRVSDDLIDSTDFLPTLCATAGAALPSPPPSGGGGQGGGPLDGRSFLPQLRGEKGQPRDWIYCWYAPNQNGNVDVPREFAADRQYKLYRGGEFYDYATDPQEKKPLDAKAPSADAAAARSMLQAALDKYKNARPAKLAGPAK
jgi:arylsulfatase A